MVLRHNKLFENSFSDKGWLVLQKVTSTVNKSEAILAGGTALAIQLGHRVSYDLDFFTNKKINVENIIRELNSNFKEIKIMSEDEDTLVADLEGIKFSIFHFPYKFIDDIVEFREIRLAGILDIASMKIIAITQRGVKRDFVDLYQILTKTPFYKVAETLVSKYGSNRINPILIGKALVYFTDAESDPEPNYKSKNSTDWSKIKKFFKTHVKQFVLDIDQAKRI